MKTNLEVSRKRKERKEKSETCDDAAAALPLSLGDSSQGRRCVCVCARERDRCLACALACPCCRKHRERKRKKRGIDRMLARTRPSSLSPPQPLPEQTKKTGGKKLQASSPSNRSRKRQPSRATQESSAPCASQRSWTRATKLLRPRPPLLLLLQHQKQHQRPSPARAGGSSPRP